MMHVLWVVVLAAVGCAARGHQGYGDTTVSPSTPSPPVTRTPAGSLRGSWLRTRRGRLLRAYRGVRYAEPPVGHLRFQPPRPITEYEAEVDATRDGPACPQPTYGDYYVDEDCLRLNVYTPRHVSNPLPVVVYLHAGGFYAVSGRSDVAGPDYLLDRDIVLVTVNYRLASLGFLSTGDALAPGNNGFKDQVVALRWVRRNIAAFGGNPELVTLTGYSAGSFSVMLHMVSPMSTGLFHRAISMSGSPISQVPLPSHQRHLATRQAELMNCPHNSTQLMLECLRTKTSKELGDSLPQFAEFADDPVLIWVPIIEDDFGQERFLVEHPLESIRRGRVQNVPYIVSQTQDEFFWKAYSILANASVTQTMDAEWSRVARISFQLPAGGSDVTARLRRCYLGEGPLRNDSATAAGIGKLYNDGLIGFGVHTLVNALAVYSPSLPLYYYEFGYIGNHSHYQDPVTNKPTGAAHHDDLIYLFGITASFPLVLPSVSRDSRQVDRMTHMWHTFALTGDPNPSPRSPLLDYTWPRFTHSERKYLRIDNEYSVRDKLFEDRFHVWERLFNTPHCEYCTY